MINVMATFSRSNIFFKKLKVEEVKCLHNTVFNVCTFSAFITFNITISITYFFACVIDAA